jgi:DNA repair exonuclease SbcCD ATPase subunit
MSETKSVKQLRMPHLQRARLDHFSLYSSKRTIEVSFGKGAFCLAGANGLGKSTFLAAINFGLTGIVADPNRKFESVDEYYNYSLEFADEFFDGRIGEGDRDRAQVSVDFAIGPNIFHLTRGVFEREQLRAFSVKSLDGAGPEIDGKSLSPADRHRHLIQTLPPAVGLDSFEQFVFLQHFVFTFDERRHLLFWDETVLEQALHLCFGLDPKDADRADSLRREAEGADSLVRNFQWQATQLRQKVQQLESITSSDDSDKEVEKVVKDYKQLTSHRDNAEKVAQKAEEQKRDTEVLFAKMTAEVATLNTEYEQAFNEYVKRSASPAAHPIVKSSLSDGRCGLCATEGPKVISEIKGKLDIGLCPLCDSPFAVQSRPSQILKQLDSKLAKAKEQLREISGRRDRVAADAFSALKASNAAISAVDRFEREHSSLLSAQSENDASAIQRTVAGYRDQINALLLKKQKQYDKREKKRKELRRLQRKLIGQYSEAEEAFVPVFKALAHSFLGIDLDIQLEAKSGGVSLTLSVRDTPRRMNFQLSESQRFFVDIALRMALLKFTSPSDKTACLLIDTPEGALDIAYEKRVGDMFARFVLDGFNLIFTANINTSQLLIALATLCGKAHMKLYRMTVWTRLSEVQNQEEHLFNKAYRQINSALVKGAKKRSRAVHV